MASTSTSSKSSANPIPTGFEGIIPHLVCDPCDKALEFYKNAFGAEEIRRMPAPDGKRIMHAAIRIGDRPIYLADDFPEFCGGKASSPQALGGSPVTFHRYVPDCDAAVEKAQKAGATVVMQPEDMFWGDRYAVIRDPFGHNWAFATQVKDMSEAEMAEAAKTAFSQPS